MSSKLTTNVGYKTPHFAEKINRLLLVAEKVAKSRKICKFSWFFLLFFLFLPTKVGKFM